MMKRLALVPNDPIHAYINAGYQAGWLRDYFNPCGFFDEVYVLSPGEDDNPDVLGMITIKAQPTQLRGRLKELDIDVVRAYNHYWACDMVCDNRANGIPAVVSVHNMAPQVHKSIKKADIVLCAQPLRSFVMEQFKREDRIWDLPNGVDFNRMRRYDKHELVNLPHAGCPFKYRILQIGRKAEQKNIETIIRALKILGADYCLLAAGKGAARPYEELAEQEGVRERCYFVKAIRNDDVPRYFSWADCLCHPSRWEGMSFLLLEALASQAVIVASDIPEIRFLIAPGQNGLLVKDYENPGALAEVLRRACTDERLRAALRANSRASVAQYEEHAVDRLHADFYAKILSMKKANVFRHHPSERAMSGLRRGVRGSLLYKAARNIKKKLHR
jgi:glycosyltransferase involved in cell wall biosynthesis